MKKALISVLTLAAMLSAQAQGAAPGAAGQKPSTTPPVQEVNPFTGKPLSVEQVQRELEESRLRTQMLEESLKQTNLREELNNVPLRKSVEAAQARTAVAKEESAQRDIEQVRKLAVAPAAVPATKPAKKLASVNHTKPAVAANDSATTASAPAPVVAAPKPVRPVVTSVMDIAGSRSAIIDFNGNTLVVNDGGMTPMGPMKILDERSINLNGEVFRVHEATLSRFVVSDAQPTTPSNNAVSSQTAPAAPATATVSPPAGSNGNPTNAATAPQRAALPPLQLPPGVSILPAPH